MNPFLKFETYFVSLVVGGLAHFQALHPGVVDPFYSGAGPARSPIPLRR